MNFTLEPGTLKLSDLHLLLNESSTLSLSADALAPIKRSHELVSQVIQQGDTVYGINTGFGALAKTKISLHDLTQLQHALILSHAAGVGPYLSDEVVRLILLLKINSLARGYSGVRFETIAALIKLFNAKLYPAIPAQGSVGASGDLAPLAHLSAVLLGYGQVHHQGKLISAKDALLHVQLSPLTLAPKEGLALINGTQVSTALALMGLFAAHRLFNAALIAGALSVDATRGSDTPFDERIQLVRGHQGQIKVALWLRQLLAESPIRKSHLSCEKVQDPYSLRCQPQVMGACFAQLQSAAHTLLVEANAVSDNPLIFTDDQAILSGGNFHAEPVAFAADNIALTLAEMGSLSERRIALLMDPQFSNLPPFLVKDAGINSGFMIAQVTAASLVSENKSLAHPASVDNIPTSANQEDHVSMATFAARRLQTMAENTVNIIAIEFLAACQGIDFLRPLTTSPILEQIWQLVRKNVDFYDKDRYFADDIWKIKQLLLSDQLQPYLKTELLVKVEI